MTALARLPLLRAPTRAHFLYGDDLRATWLLVRDPCAGRARVYTVYRISLTADKAAQVIGRELSLVDARHLVRQDMAVRSRGA